MNGYLKAIVQILVIVGICFSAYFWFGTTYATKDFVLSGFSEFQQTMGLDRLIFQRDSLYQLRLNIQWHLQRNPYDQGAINHLKEVDRKLDILNNKIEAMTCPGG